MRELFVREAPELYAYACALPGTTACTAEDLVQTAFQEAIFGWRTVGRYTPDEQRRWLRRVLKNKAIDDWRRPLTSCWAQMRRMPPVRQRVAFLFWEEGWTTPQIAAHLGLSASTVRGHLCQARKQLRSSHGHLLDEDDAGREERA